MIDAVQGGVAYEPIGGLPEPGPSTEPGGSVSFEVPAGIYDVLALDCDDATLLDETDVDVTADTTLTYP
jgi:hypothetical protein